MQGRAERLEHNMALPNYSPSGRILFGSVPWDNSYSHVRLYSSLAEQQSDVASLMTKSTDNYVYVGRDRRLKVSLCADELYHCNYCMYRNESVTDGWIYCFVSNVTYVNDHTSEVTLETDVFQTYLYGTDWTVPACFIERETAPSDTDEYMWGSEPDFSLAYDVDGVSHKWFDVGGFVVMSASKPEENSNLIEDILNPNGYYAEPANVTVMKGVPQGANYYFAGSVAEGMPIITENLESILNTLAQAGSTESIVSVMSIPDFYVSEYIDSFGQGWNQTSTHNDDPGTFEASFSAPEQGTSLNGYVPRNKKLLRYPYTYLRLTDYNGSVSELRYELLGNSQIDIKYVPSPTCQALVYPDLYMGRTGYDAGIVTAAGTQGSWSSQTYQNWLAQNSGMIALTIAGVALAGLSGATSLAAASRALVPVEAASPVMVQQGLGAALASGAGRSAMLKLSGAAAGAGMGYQTLTSASKQPTVTRGQSSPDSTFASGMQGAHAERVCCVSAMAEMVDEFFDRWGYAIERVEQPNVTSRPSWNYVKTQGCAARSTNTGAGSSAPFSRGRGTPADALDVIRRAFDSGVTFWHTTDGFGNFSLANGVS